MAGRKGRPVLIPTEAVGQIRNRRLELKLTLRALGEMIGLSESEMSLIERGLRKPSFEKGMALADALGITAEELYRPSPQEVTA